MPKTVLFKDCSAFLREEGFSKRTGILVKNGKISQVKQDLSPPRGATVIDAKGAFVTPGLIDGHTHLALSQIGDADYNEITSPVTPYLSAADAIYPFNHDLPLTLANGITTVMSCPGSANVIGGTTVALKTRGQKLSSMILRNPAAMKMALGQNPKRCYGSKDKLPQTRMGNAYLMRKAFSDALHYRKERKSKKGSAKAPDLGMENLLLVLDRKIPAKVHCHRADDILTALQIADEFKFDLTVDHATEAFLIKDELVKRSVPCFVGPNFATLSKNEVVNHGFSTAGKLCRAGVKIAITTDHHVEPCWFLPISAGIAVREGLDIDDGMRAITCWPAEIIGLGKQVGSLRKGLDADIVIWNDHPLRLGKPTSVYVNGSLVTREELEPVERMRDI